MKEFDDYLRRYQDLMVQVYAGAVPGIRTSWNGEGPDVAAVSWADLQPRSDATIDELKAARSIGRDEERARILAALEAIKPMEQPYTRRDWAIEQKGEKAMFAKVMKAIQP